MTLQEFYTAFSEVMTPVQWKSPTNCIRHKRSGHCPLSFVAARRKRGVMPCSISRSAEILGLTERIASNIADAADGITNGAIRKKLLAIVKG